MTYKAIYTDLLTWAEHWSKYKQPGESPQDQGWRFAAQEVLGKLKRARSVHTSIPVKNGS